MINKLLDLILYLLACLHKPIKSQMFCINLFQDILTYSYIRQKAALFIILNKNVKEQRFQSRLNHCFQKNDRAVVGPTVEATEGWR